MASRTLQAAFFPESRYGGFTDVDGTIAFYTRINSLLDSSAVVLDFGCGRGCYSDDPVPYRRQLRALKGRVQKVIGLDVDPIGYENPHIDEFRPIGSGGVWPIGDREADLVVCDSVLEHLSEPEVLFQESRRVLRPGGYLCARTPNVLSYIGFASRIIPNRFHSRVLAQAQSGRKQQDVFPTLYRCNTVRTLRRGLHAHGFDAVVYGYESEPRYLEFSKCAYRVGVLHRRLAPSWARPVLFAFAHLPEDRQERCLAST